MPVKARHDTGTAKPGGGANDDGIVLGEVIIDLLISSLIFTAVVMMTMHAMRVLAPSGSTADSPEVVLRRELADSAARALTVQWCWNPVAAAKRSDCHSLTRWSLPLPVVSPRPVAGATTVCWVVESVDRPGGVVIDDRRDLECWRHDPNAQQMVVDTYAATASSGNPDRFIPEWQASPYESRVVAVDVIEVTDEDWQCFLTPTGIDPAAPDVYQRPCTELKVVAVDGLCDGRPVTLDGSATCAAPVEGGVPLVTVTVCIPAGSEHVINPPRGDCTKTRPMSVAFGRA